jgi:PEP-CTERM motif
MRNVLILALVVLAKPIFASPILLVSSDTQVRHRDPDAATLGNPLGLALDAATYVSGPFGDTLSASIGNSSGSATFSFSESADDAVFSLSTEHAFDNSMGSTSAVDSSSTNGAFRFVALTDAEYLVSGLYTATGLAGFAHSMQLYFGDLTSPIECCFADETASQNLTGSHAIAPGVLGDGNDRDSFGGSLIGTLIAGHEYLLQFNYAIGNDTDGFGGPTVSPNNSSAAATGELRFELHSPSVTVPEPDTLALLAMGLLGFAVTRKRLSKTAARLRRPRGGATSRGQGRPHLYA